MYENKVKILDERYLSELSENLRHRSWDSVYSKKSPEEAYNVFINEMTDSINMTIPEKTLRRDKKEQNVWITKGILKSITKKNKLYKRYIKCPTVENKDKYTKYKKRIEASRGDQKQSWKVLNNVLSRGKKSTVLPDTKAKLNENQNVDDDLANSFNNYFNSRGVTLSKNINPQEEATYQQYLKGNYLNSFFLTPTDKSEIIKIITNLKSSQTVASHYFMEKYPKLVKLLKSYQYLNQMIKIN